jgi:hypothetical protein
MSLYKKVTKGHKPESKDGDPTLQPKGEQGTAMCLRYSIA